MGVRVGLRKFISSLLIFISRTQISAPAIADLKMPHVQQTYIDGVLGVPVAIALGPGVGMRGHNGPAKPGGTFIV